MVISIKENMTLQGIERMTDTKNNTDLNMTYPGDDFVGNFNSSGGEVLSDAIAKEQATIKLYSVIMMASVISAVIQTYAILDFSRRASVNIHKSMVQNIINAVMSFFDTHFIGNVLNRFSQDLNNIDEQLPFTIREAIRV